MVVAAQAAGSAWRAYGAPPDAATMDNAAHRRFRFAFLAALLDGTAHAGEIGREHRLRQRLYAETRAIVNYQKALCDFDAAHVYAGPISPDGEPTVHGWDAAVPLVPLVPGGAGSERALRLAYGQLFQWWGWPTELRRRVRQTGALGTTLYEVEDEPGSDPGKGRVGLARVWPGLVDEITLDQAGNVKGYALEWLAEERGGIDRRTGRRADPRRYRYRKVVDGTEILHYEDDRLDARRSGPNPYGFVAAVWDRSRLGWGDWGEPLIYGSQAAADGLNELWSHANDRLHQMFSMPVVVSGAQGLSDKTYGEGTRSQVNLIGVPQAGSASTIAFSLGDVMVSIEKMMGAIALECPEIRVYDRIREMGQVTGPGIRRAVADVEHRLNDRAGLYDQQTVKMLQMATAIAGWRIANGEWGQALTEQQEKFRPFGLDSYKAGRLDCMILPRELVKPTLVESAEEQAAIEALRDRASLEAMGLPADEVEARIAGQAKEEARAEAATARELARFAARPEPGGAEGEEVAG